jgi:hypothetical protein
MQMQQIQTPTGPKLIAVPVGGGSIQLNTSGQFQSLSGLQFTSIGGQPATITNQGLTVQSVPTMGGLGIASSTFSESTLTQTFSTAQTTTMSSPMTSNPIAESPASSKKKAWKKKKAKDEEVMVSVCILLCNSCHIIVQAVKPDNGTSA